MRAGVVEAALDRKATAPVCAEEEPRAQTVAVEEAYYGVADNDSQTRWLETDSHVLPLLEQVVRAAEEEATQSGVADKDSPMRWLVAAVVVAWKGQWAVVGDALEVTLPAAVQMHWEVMLVVAVLG